MINIALHDPIDIIRFILPIIPSLVIFFSVLLQEYHQHKHIGYAVLCILLGFTFFPSNEYVGMTVGIFVCCIIYLNYERVHKGKQFGGVIFPCLFFFNLCSFSGVNKFENLCMVIYAIVGCVYIWGLSIKRDDKEFLIHHEKFCIVLSSILFICLKIIFLLFTGTLIAQ